MHCLSSHHLICWSPAGYDDLQTVVILGTEEVLDKHKGGRNLFGIDFDVSPLMLCCRHPRHLVPALPSACAACIPVLGVQPCSDISRLCR